MRRSVRVEIVIGCVVLQILLYRLGDEPRCARYDPTFGRQIGILGVKVNCWNASRAGPRPFFRGVRQLWRTPRNLSGRIAGR
jgi:hypothetical protein